MIKGTIPGNIFDCEEDIIVHQTNCQGVMGHGIALQVKQRYFKVFTDYFNYCKEHKGNKPAMLGTTLIVPTGKDSKYVANIFGQLDFGEGLQTDYEKLRSGLRQVHEFAKKNRLSVAIPYKIGCGLANGDWNIVEKMITDIFSDDVPCTIYRFERNERY